MTAVILAFAVSCKKQEQEVAAASSIELVLEDNILSVAAEGGDFVVSYNIVDPVEGGKVSASVDKDWVENLNYETDGKIAFHLGENDGEDSRSALVTVAYTAEDGTVVDEAEFTVEQAAAGQEEPEPEIVKVELTDYLAESTSYYPGESVDNFYLSLYTGEVELYESEEGSIYVPADTESQLLHLDLYCQPVADGGDLVLPEGTYTVADNMDAGSAYGYYTFAIRYFDDGMLGYADPVEGGTVVVEHTEDGYSITASFEMVRMDNGASLGKCEYTYSGPLAFLDMSEPEPPTQEEMYPPLTESINTVFTGCDIRYLGVPAYSSPIDCYVIDLFDDPTPGEDGSLDERVWYFVRGIQGVIGFIGGSDRPQPLSQQEIDYILMQTAEPEEKAKPKIQYEIGETVRIKDGAFENFEGVVRKIDAERGKLELEVSIFGRSTPVELEFWQVVREQ